VLKHIRLRSPREYLPPQPHVISLHIISGRDLIVRNSSHETNPGQAGVGLPSTDSVDSPHRNAPENDLTPGKSRRLKDKGFHVVVDLNGMSCEDIQQKTRSIKKHGTNPFWNEVFSFSLKDATAGQLTLRVFSNDACTGFVSIPLIHLRSGYRTIQLYQETVENDFVAEPMEMSSLFVRVKLDTISDFNSYSQADLPAAYTKPENLKLMSDVKASGTPEEYSPSRPSERRRLVASPSGVGHGSPSSRLSGSFHRSPSQEVSTLERGASRSDRDKEKYRRSSSRDSEGLRRSSSRGDRDRERDKDRDRRHSDGYRRSSSRSDRDRRRSSGDKDRDRDRDRDQYRRSSSRSDRDRDRDRDRDKDKDRSRRHSSSGELRRTSSSRSERERDRRSSSDYKRSSSRDSESDRYRRSSSRGDRDRDRMSRSSNDLKERADKEGNTKRHHSTSDVLDSTRRSSRRGGRESGRTLQALPSVVESDAEAHITDQEDLPEDAKNKSNGRASDYDSDSPVKTELVELRKSPYQSKLRPESEDLGNDQYSVDRVVNEVDYESGGDGGEQEDIWSPPV
jgi:hypothetical protein